MMKYVVKCAGYLLVELLVSMVTALISCHVIGVAIGQLYKCQVSFVQRSMLLHTALAVWRDIVEGHEVGTTVNNAQVTVVQRPCHFDGRTIAGSSFTIKVQYNQQSVCFDGFTITDDVT
jgi:hypothetical protein